jgi:hypothetical protein
LSETLTVRAYSEQDAAELLRIHSELHLGYEFPSMVSPAWGPGIVLADNSGKIMAAARLRMTAEAFLFMDKRSTPGLSYREVAQERYTNLLALHEMIRREAKTIGLEHVHAFLPPEFDRRFAKRLERLGWVKEPFACWVRSTEGATWQEA